MACGTSCAYSDGRLFFRANDSLMCYDVRAKGVDSDAAWIAEFTADRLSLTAGEEALLSWQTHRADSVIIEPGIGKVEPNGTKRVAPAKNTVYTLTVTGQGKSETKELSVDVLKMIAAKKVSASFKPGLAMHIYDLKSPDRRPQIDKLKHRTTETSRHLSFSPGLDRNRAKKDVTSLPTVPPDQLDGLITDIVGNDLFAGFQQTKNVVADLVGYIEVPADGVYSFSVSAQGRAALYVGNRMVVEHNGKRGLKGLLEEFGSVALARGRHPIRIVFARGSGPYALYVHWSGPGITKSLVPEKSLSHTDADLKAVNKSLPVIEQ
jgi:hypothetical protein